MKNGKGLKREAKDAGKSNLTSVKGKAAPRVQTSKGVRISGEAQRGLAHMFRQWSGWDKASIQFQKKDGAPGHVDHVKREFSIDVDGVLRNPNKVLNTMTPFRFKQEAPLTGVMAHEAGHARHTLWIRRTKDEQDSNPLLHSDDGSGDSPTRAVPTEQCMAVARLMEEARVEGLMVKNAKAYGFDGYEWTMRASNAALLPYTELDTNPEQQVMDVLTSWALRAGKQLAYNHYDTTFELKSWVQDLTTLFHGVIVAHLDALIDDRADGLRPDSGVTATTIIQYLCEMVINEDDHGPFMIDKARDVLALLFPETQQDQSDDDGDPDDSEGEGSQPPPPMPKFGHGQEPEPDAEGDEGEADQGEGGEGNSEPEDEGSGDDPGAGDSGQDDSEPEPDDRPEIDQNSELAEALRDLEQQMQGANAEDEKKEMAEATKADTSVEAPEGEDEAGGKAGGYGSWSPSNGEWRAPTKDEREIQHGAERFLRDMIAPSDRSKVTLSDQPSTQIDGAAYAAWKAQGRRGAPRFFKQTRREVQPSPPVKIAVLVDRSGSMDILQKPSALLSWALASAALDLRNFAGRGVQVESTLIHWGSTAEVLQRNGQTLPGIREIDCHEGTNALAQAIDLIDEQIPGFTDMPDKAVSRLIVNFTDWELTGGSQYGVAERLSKAMGNGVNMLSVVPNKGYSVRSSKLPWVLSQCKNPIGTSSLIQYNPSNPGAVWTSAAEVLSTAAMLALDPDAEVLPPAPFEGF